MPEYIDKLLIAIANGLRKIAESVELLGKAVRKNLKWPAPVPFYILLLFVVIVLWLTR